MNSEQFTVHLRRFIDADAIVCCERRAEVRICHNRRDVGLTLVCNNQRGAGHPDPLRGLQSSQCTLNMKNQNRFKNGHIRSLF